ncbi:MAG: AraC family transcriptional regulator [Caldilineaceae bacterium]
MTQAQPMQKLADFIDQNLDHPLTVDDLAQRVHLSPYHFIRRFQAAFHQTPHQYVINRRLERAKALLANSELPVTEICLSVGFESLGSFSTLFRKQVGWSPSVYRARVWAQRRTPLKFIPGCMRLMHGITFSPADGSEQS